MGKSKKRKVYDNGKENDQLRTVAGLSNIGEAIEEALAKDGGNITEAEVVTETNTDTAQPEQQSEEVKEVKTDQTPAPEQEPEQQVKKPCKPVPHWSSDPGAQFNNLFNEVIELMVATNQTDEFIAEFRNETLSMPTRDDAIASLTGLMSKLKPIVETTNVPVDVENNINKSMEEKKMENSNNVNTNTPVAAPATATISQDQLNALMAAQQQAVAKPAQSTSALTTTEKVVLWTAAGVAVTALIVGFVAVAKASKANGRINDLELGTQL